ADPRRPARFPITRGGAHRQHAHSFRVAATVSCTHRLDSQIRVLDDGRRVTLRHAVPSDAPRLVLLLGSAFASEDGRVALDDHGIIVGHVVGTSEPVVSEAWLESELAVLLAGPRSEG